MVQRYIPAKIQPWQRRWKTATAFITVGASYYLTFWYDWARISLIPPDHIFSRAQHSHREWLKKILGDKYVRDIKDPYAITSDTTHEDYLDEPTKLQPYDMKHDRPRTTGSQPL